MDWVDARRRGQQMKNEWIDDFGSIRNVLSLAHGTGPGAGPTWSVGWPALAHGPAHPGLRKIDLWVRPSLTCY